MTTTPDTLAAVLAARAAEAPDHPALTDRSRRWTWAELDRRARQLARALREAGVRPRDRVAVVGGRSAETVLGLLGILYAGAAYCVVDTAFPAGRRAAVLARLRPAAVVEAAPGETPGGLDCPIVPLDAHTVLSEAPAVDGPAEVDPQDLAYVLFTSGSTGTPKGVQIEQHSVLNMVRAVNELAPCLNRPVGTMVGSPGFDVTVWEVFNTLVNGGTVHVPDDEVVRDPERLWDELCERRVNHAYLPAGMLAELVDIVEQRAAGGERVSGGDQASGGDQGARACVLDRVLVGVEPLPQQLLGRLVAAVPGLRLINGYGPTESTVVGAMHLFDRVEDPWRRTPIGRAVAGMAVHLLDDELRPVPAGEVGQIVLTGAGLARGYLDAPELTAAAFVHLPDSGERAYLTGDYGRLLPDGALEFAGRRDSQLKIDGVRVELGETEAVLGAHPAVRRALAIVTPTPVGPRLAAAMEVEDPEAPGLAEELGSWAADRLPAAARPTRIILTAAFPLTANGKVDTAALLADRSRPTALGPATAAEGEREQLVLDVWREVLDAPWLGVTDPFPAVGGGSLAAMHIASRLRRHGLAVGATDTLTAGTVRELARRTATEQPTDEPEAPGRATQPGARLGRKPAARSQEGLWAWRELHPESSDTTVVHAVRLDGAYDRDRLRRAVARVAARHEALRTVFAAGEDGRPVQLVQPAPGADPAPSGADQVPFGVHAAADRDAVQARIDHWLRHRFDVSRACWHAELVTAPGTAALVLAADHLVFDGWSAELFEAHLAEAYQDPDAEPALAPGAHPADAAEAQRRLLAGPQGTTLRQYWSQALDGFTDTMLLPEPFTAGPAPARRTSVLEQRLDATATAALGRLAAAAGTTRFTAVTAAFKAYLHLRGLGPDNTVSIAASTRDTFDAHSAIGYFVNLVPLRDRVREDQSFPAYLRELAALAGRALDHAALPFEEIIQSLDFTGGTPGPARVVVAQHVAPAGPRTAAGLTFGRWPSIPSNAVYDLALFVEDGHVAEGFGDEDERIRLRWLCDPAQFLDGTRERLADGFAAFLAALAEHPELPLGELPAMGAAEQLTVLGGPGRPLPPPAPRETLTALVDGHAARDPQATAVIDGDRRLGYAELVRRAEAIAAGLGADADQQHPVAVVLEKSADLVAGLLAVLKAGSCYLPLAPEHAATRLADLAGRSGARVVLTREGLLDPAELPDGMSLVLVDRVADRVADSAAGAARVADSPAHDALAYVMPTSGSTGVPKLVGIPHHAVVRLVRESSTLPLGPQDRTLLVANSSFDAATLEVWGALANGGTVVVPTARELKDPLLLCRAIERHRITAGFFTVTLFARMVEAAPQALAGMRHLLVGGEAVPPELFAEAARSVPRSVLMNGYGPTENTTFSCCHRLDRDPAAGRSVPIGRAIHGSTAHVMDERLRPLPVGAVGEIVVGGPGLAVGYLNDPELTAQRFPAHPWAPGERVYRTGDYGRVLPDGALEYLGRRDKQLKIRGFRIEAGEVETALAAHPAVRHAVAFAVDSPTGRQLAAAVETVADSAVTPEDLRDWLGSRLPGYLVPARVGVHRDLPLTVNGKVDTGALARQLQGAGPTGAGGRRPAERAGTPVEAVVLDVLGDVLAAQLGPDDNVFHHGADSMAVLALCARLAKRLDRPVPSHVVFEYPTARSLAARLTPPAETPKASPGSRTPQPEDPQRRALLRRVAAARAVRTPR
ncbi:amino acid adenylation domain-containing protein [Streptomyces sp. 1114.5]|uniref:non-ribosomal peptide synthetase n=1 Tax=Streptomyces sp. 1114.5 TaxID=1938830 RepID=UPI000EB12FCE|nr:non-ribosomal peptide synthetase [Streptomyces sp. 1114.5]RKT11416.1 amino acid adenylation domain-containing protein [Streptomyces sp. 1114.5]